MARYGGYSPAALELLVGCDYNRVALQLRPTRPQAATPAVRTLIWYIISVLLHGAALAAIACVSPSSYYQPPQFAIGHGGGGLGSARKTMAFRQWPRFCRQRKLRH